MAYRMVSCFTMCQNVTQMQRSDLSKYLDLARTYLIIELKMFPTQDDYYLWDYYHLFFISSFQLSVALFANLPFYLLSNLDLEVA